MSVGLGTHASSSDDGAVTPCSTDLDLYLHPLLEEPPVRSTSTRQVWGEYEALVLSARAACSPCPLLAGCLYKAVVQTDVSGYVGCTTPKERAAIRRIVGVTLEAEDFDSFAGARGDRQPIHHDDVLRARTQHPDDSLEALATRLDCSLSTVKRHLRRARQEASGVEVSARAATLPTMDEVFDAFEGVVEAGRRRVS